MAVDLHAHSTASDGSVPPEQMVDMALQAGLTTLALTDHDTQGGVAAATSAARHSSLEVVPGVELSLEHASGGMHLVVLWLEPGSGPLQDRLAELRSGRDERNLAMVERLVELGLPLTIEEIEEEAGDGSVGRPHIAAVMVARGYVPDIRSAFDLWLGKGRPGYIGRNRLAPGEAISLARESGAVPVLAHPHTLGITTAGEMADVLTELTGCGLVGFEALYSSYRRHEREGYSDLARRFGLIPSGGSDFHGTYKPGLSLGNGYGDLYVPDATVEELREYAGRS